MSCKLPVSFLDNATAFLLKMTTTNAIAAPCQPITFPNGGPAATNRLLKSAMTERLIGYSSHRLEVLVGADRARICRQQCPVLYP
jgi:hypothetical protein